MSAPFTICTFHIQALNSILLQLSHYITSSVTLFPLGPPSPVSSLYFSFPCSLSFLGVFLTHTDIVIALLSLQSLLSTVSSRTASPAADSFTDNPPVCLELIHDKPTLFSVPNTGLGCCFDNLLHSPPFVEKNPLFCSALQSLYKERITGI